MEGHDRTFRVNFTSDGVARLRERVNEKLKEFMGEYTDDTLVEYVTVLLKNGRSKDEAKSELNVFLGDDSESFVSWLWDHLDSHLNSYVEEREIHLDGVPKSKSAAGVQDGRYESHQLESVAEEENKTSRKHQNQDRSGLVRGNENENHIGQSFIVDNVNDQDEMRQEVNRRKNSISPRPKIEKKKRRHEDRWPMKSQVSRTSVSAPRRLLQSAVRDAVATSRPSNTLAEHSNKRLRSVVSSSTGDSFHGERPPKLRSEVGLRSAMSVAIKAVAEAVKDVGKARPPCNVFDRLGRNTDVSSTTNHLEEYGGAAAEDGVDGAFSNEREGIHLTNRHRNDRHRQHEDEMVSLDDDIISSDFGYDAGWCDDDAIGQHGQRTAHTYQPTYAGGGREDEYLKFQYDMNDGADERRLPHKSFDRVVHVPGAAIKEVASSIIVETQKPQNQGASMMPDSRINAVKSHASSTETNKPKTAFNGNVKPIMELQQESKKTEMSTGLYSTTMPTEDADSRTIFVSNVHFAATKDSLLRHFIKFGEVLKVIILTDPGTGQPKGSAYIEFIRKEAAEQALSLDGASFMSRILKVSRKTWAQPETTSSVMRPRIARASSFGVPRPSRAPFGRGFPGIYRSRMTTKAGPRSLQWKRGTQPNEIVGPQHHKRSLTYVRMEPKAENKVNQSCN